jgi:hypothetical protein
VGSGAVIAAVRLAVSLLHDWALRLWCPGQRCICFRRQSTMAGIRLEGELKIDTKVWLKAQGLDFHEVRIKRTHGNV